MREPEYSDTTDFMKWARENKRRADALAKAATSITSKRWDPLYQTITLVELDNLRLAITAYTNDEG